MGIEQFLLIVLGAIPTLCGAIAYLYFAKEKIHQEYKAEIKLIREENKKERIELRQRLDQEKIDAIFLIETRLRDNVFYYEQLLKVNENFYGIKRNTLEKKTDRLSLSEIREITERLNYEQIKESDDQNLSRLEGGTIEENKGS